jgi:hypothetical protein
MDRRELLGTFGAAAVGMGILGAVEVRAGDEPESKHHHMDKDHEDCLRACGQCAKECNMMAHHCLDKLCEGQGPVKHHARAHSLAMDCQAFCVLSATLIARSSELMVYACEACAKACHDCAEECDKTDDAAMKKCAEVCRTCETSCKQMVRHMKGSEGSRG